jgi:putative SOS response-associated peptidase YedK
MLTTAPGPDVAVLDRSQWADWLDPSVPAKSVLKPLSAGELVVSQVG